MQGNRQALPLCVMLLIQRVLGDSVVGYDPGANGIAYDHDAWLASKLPAAMEQDDSDGDDGAECFVSKLHFDTATNARAMPGTLKFDWAPTVFSLDRAQPSRKPRDR